MDPAPPFAWLLVDQERAPPDDRWLGPWEAARLGALRAAPRRDDFRLGRYAGKRALSLVAGGDLADWEIVAAADGCPEPRRGGAPARLSISLSHRDRRALAVVCGVPVALGADLELVEPRSPAFIADFFTPSERARIAAAPAARRDELVVLLWSAKESALKALRTGLRADTRTVEVTRHDGAPDDGFRPLCVHHGPGGADLHGWWRRDRDHVLTVVSHPPLPPPRALAAGGRPASPRSPPG